MKRKLINNPIVFFDGECGLCSKSVQFIVKHDPAEMFFFSPLQSSITKNIIPSCYLSTDTVILYENHKVYTKSEAAFKILDKLKTRWRVLLVFRILPRFITDAVYDIIAKYRKRLFRSPSTCKLPNPELLRHIYKV